MRGILIVLSQGCKWRATDHPEAAWISVYHYYLRWTRQNVFVQLFSKFGLPFKGFRRFVDSTHVKVHRSGCNPRGGQAQPACLLLSAGHEADISHAPTLLFNLSASMAVGDKAYDSDPFRQWLAERGIKPCIPPRSNRKAPHRYSKRSYCKRHLVENFFERIKTFRRVATRYDKPAETFFGFVCLATTLVNLLRWVYKHALGIAVIAVRRNRRVQFRRL